METGYYRDIELNDNLNLNANANTYNPINIDSYLTSHTSQNLLAKNLPLDDELLLNDDGKTSFSSGRCSETTYDLSTRAKSISLSSGRTNSYLSLNNEAEIENTLFEGEQLSFKTELKPREKESNIFSGFFDLVNRASSFWTKKFTDRPSTLTEVPEIPSGRSSLDTFAPKAQESHETLEDNTFGINIKETAPVIPATNKTEVETTEWTTSNKVEEPSQTEQESKWTAQDDKLLIKYADEYQADWKKIAKMFNTPSLTPKFLKDRYKGLKEQGSNKKTRFSHHEDLTIVKYYKKIGSNWDAIAKYLPDRTPSMIKNRFYSSIRKKGMIESLYKELGVDGGSSVQVKEESSTAVGLTTSHCSPIQEHSNQYYYDPLSSVGIDITLDQEPQEHHMYLQRPRFNECDDQYEIFRSPCTYLNIGHENKYCEDNTDRFFNSDELVNTRIYGNNFDVKEDFLDYQKSHRQQYFQDIPEETVKNFNLKVNPAEENKDVFTTKPAQEKIELIKSKLSSIHMLFQETKFELEKIQKSFKA